MNDVTTKNLGPCLITGTGAPVQPITAEETDAEFERAETPTEILTAMQKRCAEFRADAEKRNCGRVRQAGAMTPDTDVLWQGDVGVVLPSESAMQALKGRLSPMKVEGSHAQVAVGSGVGARHLVSLAEVSVFNCSGAGVLDGPVVVADNDWTLTHPEHQNVTFPPGTYRITYQRSFAEDLRRAAD